MSQDSQVTLYQTSDGKVELEVRMEHDSVWLRQEQMSELFGRERSVITKHLRNIFVEGELEEKSNVQNLHIAGSNKPVKFYNLDVVLSVGYRVNSKRATQFRIWATKTLKDHLVQGYTINEKRLLEAKEKFVELQSAISLLSAKAKHKLLSGQEQEILNLLALPQKRREKDKWQCFSGLGFTNSHQRSER